jgi:predicted metal-dependent enzyme (double-stranded beta helix superfamily)
MPASPSAPALSLEVLTALVRRIAADQSLWHPRLVLPSGADRWWTRLSADADADVWLLSWLPGQFTDLHDHGDSAAAFAVVQGELTELRLDRAGEAAAHRRVPGSVTWVAPGVIHDVHGDGAGPAVSIHAYSPALERMTYYDRSGRAVRTVQTSAPEEDFAGDPDSAPQHR